MPKKAKKATKILSRAYPVPMDVQWTINSIRGNKNIITERAIVNGKLEVGFISGCRSNQTSADAFINNRYNGALTYYLLKVLRQNNKQNLQSVVNQVNTLLRKGGYSQQPCCEGSRGNLPLCG
jgi:hypothetical protein